LKDKKSIFEKIKFIEKIPESSKEEDPFNDEISVSNQSADSKEDDNKSISDQVNIDVTVNTYKKNIEEYAPYTSDKVTEISDIYKNEGIIDDNIKSIYIIDSFLKALPETLPNEAKRQSVLNIISASGMNLETLLEDGKNRVNLVHTFHKGFTSKTDEITRQCKIAIEELTAKIEKYKDAISQREDLQKEQDLKLEYEIQKIENIISFINRQ
jgi:hypothetical protein